MEVYILDSSLRRTEVVESYESMLWTERYSESGDFELQIDPRLADTPLTVQGTPLGIDKSDRTMFVDTVERVIKEDGTKVLSCKGKSLEELMKQRLNKYDKITTGAAKVQFTLSGLPMAIVRNLVDDILRTGTYFSNSERFPLLQAGTITPLGTIAEPGTSVDILLDVGTLYDTVKNIADIYGFGFRIVRVADDSKVYFEAYTGYDRTTGQTANPAVVFSEALDSLTDTQDIQSSAMLKNVAYVFGANGSRVVFADNVDPAISGFNKRVLMVDATDITTTAGATLNAQLDQRGKEELAKNTYLWAFDGKIPTNGSYLYGTDYKLGDLVEQRSDTGATTVMKVTEQIFVSDAEGEKSYPTLTLNNLLVPGSWDAMQANKTWDIYTTETWNSM